VNIPKKYSFTLQNTNMNKQETKPILIILAISGALSYAGSDFYDPIKIFALSLTALMVYYYGFFQKPKGNDEIAKMLEESDEVIKQQEDIIAEQNEVIQEYEEIFDGQVTRLDCPCGQNKFEGLFEANVENIVDCEKCGERCKVLVSFDTILMSKPLNNDEVMPQIEAKIKEKDQ
jgi:hypothetical protein